MSAREWKPGDVGMVTDDHGTMRVAVHGGVNPRMKHRWHYDEAGIGRILQPRPLVVIDPEDRKQVERLARCLPISWNLDQPDDPGAWVETVDEMVNALREFADPKPRIEEPTGWLSVVEDGMGVQWYRWSVRPQDADKAWISVMDERRCYPTGFDQINAVRAVAPGVEVTQ